MVAVLTDPAVSRRRSIVAKSTKAGDEARL